MDYDKQYFLSGDTLFAAQLNAMDDQIAANAAAIADLLYQPIQIVSFAATPAVAELGSTANSVDLNYAISKIPETAQLDGTEREITTASGQIQLTGLNLSAGKTWTLAVTDERENTDSKTASLAFANRVYYGAAHQPGSISSAFLSALSGNALSASRGRTISVNAGDDQYIWYAVPARLGTCVFRVGGFDGGFSLVHTFPHQNASGYTESYDVYRSDHAGLGLTSITIS